MDSVLGVLHVVSNLDQMVSFFTEVLDFKEVGRLEWSGSAFEHLCGLPKAKGKLSKLQLGNQFSYLLEFSPSQKGSFPEDSRSNDLWFQHIAIVVSDMEKAYSKVIKYGVSPISDSYQTIPDWNKPAAGVKAFYFRSPDGHPLELIYFPEGKGNPVWQNKTSLFLGIDHTAIGVANTQVSLMFYQEILGMQEVGGSLNYGITQEKLSGVPGAKVKITTVQFSDSEGIGIEFLEYQNPLDGRKKPKEIKINHLVENQTLIEVNDLSTIISKMGVPSQKPIAFHGFMGYEMGIMAFDPDGHRLLLLQR